MVAVSFGTTKKPLGAPMPLGVVDGNDNFRPVAFSAAPSDATRRLLPFEVQRSVPKGSVCDPDGAENPMSADGE